MTAPSTPEVSVIVAVRNGAATLRRCLASVPGEVELLVVDGASTDGSVDIIRRAGDRVAWWCSEPDGGIYPAWNKALRHATHEWVLFLGADDWIEAGDAWSATMESLSRVRDAFRVAYGRVRVVTASGREIATVGESWAGAGPRFPRHMSLPHQGVFHRRVLFSERGPFDETFAISGDYELLLRELLNCPAHFLEGNHVVANMTVGGLSLRGTRMLQHVREIRRARERHGVFTNGPEYWAQWARAALRVCGSRLLGDGAAGRMADAVRRATGQPAVWSVR